MGKSLVIVESPNKVKTISKFLGADYIVNSSVGHIRDLPSSKKKSTSKKETTKSTSKVKLTPEEKIFNSMGINPKTWSGDYQILEDKKAKVAELRKLAKSAEFIYLATDLDREGEAIAWHLHEVLKDVAPKQAFRRVTFNEITAKSVKEAFAHPTTLNMDMVNAQQTRRFLDRIVGYMVSPLLWKKVARNLSAGRVQSVATKMLVEREREIAAYKPIDFWKITATSPQLPKQGEQEIIFELDSIGDKKITAPEVDTPYFVSSTEMMEQIMADLNNKPATVVKVEKKKQISRPNPPFTTASLQRTASTVLGFPIKKTMNAAQRLYEEGLITYMRTDALNLSAESINMARQYISDKYGAQYIPPKANYYANRNANAQEAHEAIRPTDPNNSLTGRKLTAEQLKIYQLILERFLACQAADAIFQSTTILTKVEANSQDYLFKTSARVMEFDGWHRIIKSNGKELLLSNFEQGQSLPFVYHQQQSATRPPARYNEASLVKELESRSIGRPSTYVSIIGTIQDRGYAKLENKKFYATDIAQVVTNNLELNFDNLLDYGFTAELENHLDKISLGQEDWKKQLNTFLTDLRHRITVANQDENIGGMPINKPIPTTIKCPISNHNLAVRVGTTGVFLGCEGYYDPDQDKRCTHTQNLVAITEDDEDSPYPGLSCYLVDSNTKLYLDYQNHLTYKVSGDFKSPNTPELNSIPCDVCHDTEGGVMTYKEGRFGPYMGCNKCKNTRRVLANGEIAPIKVPAIEYPELRCKNKDYFFVLRRSSRGIFFGANSFPKARDVMPTFVHVLQAYPERLPEDLRYLLTAPIHDPEGNDTIVRWDIKQRKQYIGSLNPAGKATKFRIDYQNGGWS